MSSSSDDCLALNCRPVSHTRDDEKDDMSLNFSDFESDSDDDGEMLRVVVDAPNEDSGRTFAFKSFGNDDNGDDSESGTSSSDEEEEGGSDSDDESDSPESEKIVSSDEEDEEGVCSEEENDSLELKNESTRLDEDDNSVFFFPRNE